jgi:hypothetical protein
VKEEEDAAAEEEAPQADAELQLEAAVHQID